MFERTERGLLARWWWTVDRPLLGVFGLLALSGLIMVFASSPPVAVRLGLPSWHFVTRHLIYLAPAALLLVGCSLLSPRGVYRAAIALLAVSILMLVATLIIGLENNGSTRWISFGSFAIQPGEF
ncbi:MAG: FtsW/RodA/SpoVE family cell cycle protein, partial [Pseudomonadota bacterium]